MAMTTSTEASSNTSALEAKKVVVVGSASSGKSALVQRAMTNTFSNQYQQTFGADLCVKTTSEKYVSCLGPWSLCSSSQWENAELKGGGCLDRNKYSLKIWCCGGHERYRALLEQFFVGTNAVILCFDMLSIASFQELPFWYNEFKRNSPDALAIMVGTKSDDADSIKVPIQDALKQAKEWGIEFRAVSSKTGMNVTELFDHIMSALP
ncbi:Ras- protein Rab-35 [Thoreauomyces humboldtii]|nr:Ras- protein Rab-35 [Thoreauomyces humboldtii]